VLGEHEGGHVLEHRHLDRLAFATAFARKQRGEDALGGDQPDHVVGEHHRHEARLAEHPPVGVGHAGQALDDGVVGGAVPVAPGAPESHEVAHDQPWMPAAQGLDPEAEPRQRGRAHIGDEDIRGVEQPMQRLAAFIALEIEGERALVAVEVHELAGQLAAVRLAAERAQQVAAGRFHLDHVGAVVGEKQRRRGSDHDGGEIDDTNAGKRSPVHRAPPLMMPASRASRRRGS